MDLPNQPHRIATTAMDEGVGVTAHSRCHLADATPPATIHG